MKKVDRMEIFNANVLIIIFFIPQVVKIPGVKNYKSCYYYYIIIFLAHQHKACRQLKIKQEMSAVGD